MTAYDRANNTAYTELFDAYYQATTNCMVAENEVTAAKKVLREYRGLANAAIANEEASDELQLSRCRSHRAA